MRKSIIIDDIGYDPEAWKYSVYLNDERMEYVFTADEKKGFVVVFDASISGSFMRGRPDQPVMKRLDGDVRILEEESIGELAPKVLMALLEELYPTTNYTEYPPIPW
jgi:hypothetical protein